MSKCVNCGRYTNQILCDYCLQEIQNGSINPPKNYNSNDSLFDNKLLQKYNMATNNPKYALAPYQENRIYKCKNGNMVRSKSERDISDFLTEHQIEHAYEKALKTNNEDCPYLHPDFYIPAIVTHTGRIIRHIFIEHLGGPMSNDPQKTKKYWENNTQKFYEYEKMKLTVLCTYEKDMINPNESLKHKLLTIKENKINY